MLKLLLIHGADPNAIDPLFNGQTPLHRATLKEDLNMVQMLLDHGADTTVTDKDGNHAIDLVRDGDDQDAIRELLAGHLQPSNKRQRAS